MKKLLLATLLSCLSFANPAKASVTVIVGAVTLTVGDQGDMGPPGGIDIDIPAAQAYGISYSEPQNFFSFYWASRSEQWGAHRLNWVPRNNRATATVCLTITHVISSRGAPA